MKKKSKISSGILVRPTEARIDLRALAHNYRCLREKVGQTVGVIGVVKADAYGHGAVRISRLLEGLGVRAFGVATVEEGVELREAGIRAPILIMGAAFGRDHREVVDHHLTPMIGDPSDIDHFAQAAQAAGISRFSVHLKIDTGMSRLGVTLDHLAATMQLCSSYHQLRVDGVATHFAAADDQDPGYTTRQLKIFVQALDQIRKMGGDPQFIHAANTAACLRFPKTRFDFVRPGLVLYGALPSVHFSSMDLRPVMSWHTRIIALRRLPVGARVSYGGSFVTSRPSTIATLPVGYADGYSRSLSNRAEVLLHGQRAKVVGTVCMDLCMIDVTDIPQTQIGDRVILLGGVGQHKIMPEELAQWAQTISYEVMVGISRRVPRVYDQPAIETGEQEPPFDEQTEDYNEDE